MILLSRALLVAHGTITECDVVIRDGHIHGIYDPGTGHHACAGDVHVIDADGFYLSHGFIDTHVHGGGGHDYMDGTEEAWIGIGRTHMAHGTTGIVPTTLSSDPEELLATLGVYTRMAPERHDGPRILGIHVEGPYLSPAQSGAQDPDHLKDPDPEVYTQILDACPHIVKWTIAPELPGADRMADALTARGIIPCIGHSNATADQVREALAHGFKIVTHLYSACSTITRDKGFRRAGVVESAYIMPALMSELIADGCHLPGDLLTMAYRFIGPDRLILVTDAMRAAGRLHGESILGSKAHGQRVILEDGVAKLPSREAFAGSIATTDRLVRTMLRCTEADLPSVITMMTETPARSLGMSAVTGTVLPGRRADLVLFDEDINIHMTMIDGVIRHQTDQLRTPSERTPA